MEHTSKHCAPPAGAGATVPDVEEEGGKVVIETIQEEAPLNPIDKRRKDEFEKLQATPVDSRDYGYLQSMGRFYTISGNQHGSKVQGKYPLLQYSISFDNGPKLAMSIPSLQPHRV